jgi:hypothetical protein
MTWVQIDDAMAEHPKVLQLGDRAFRVHIEALCYSNRNLTDGFVPKVIGHSRGKRYATELVTAGIWDTATGGYLIHDYHDYQPSAAQVEARRAANTDRVRRHRQARGRVDRAQVWERDQGVCGICGEQADPDQWEVDHIVPLAAGGKHILSNVQVAHPACNASKGARGPGIDVTRDIGVTGRGVTHYKARSNGPVTEPPILNPNPQPFLGQSSTTTSRIDLEIKNGKTLKPGIEDAILSLVRELPDANDGTIGRLVKFAQDGAQQSDFHDARQGIAATHPRSPSSYACTIIANHIKARA